MIVVGVDGSASALQAVLWAADEAVRHKDMLRLVHVCLMPTELSGGLDANLVRDLLRQGRGWLDEARQVAAEAGADAITVLNSASVVPALVNESLSASLLVLGTRGLDGFTGLPISSTAVSLAGRVHCPMVVVRGDEPVTGPVVIGVDGLPDAKAAVAFAFAEASVHGTDLVAVHTWRDSLANAMLLGHPTPPDFERAQQRAYETLGKRLAGWQEKYPDVHVTREVVRDHPSLALLRYAKGAQLVVVGTRGLGGFRGLLFGSTSQHLLHHAPCPVAVVHTEPSRRSDQ